MAIFSCPMKRTAAVAAVLGLMVSVSAVRAAETLPPEFAGADLVKGQKFYTELKCAACHAERMMGSTSAIYTRSDRKVHNPKQLLAFTQMCVTQLNHDLFPEEVKDIAAYLNQTYYKFK